MSLLPFILYPHCHPIPVPIATCPITTHPCSQPCIHHQPSPVPITIPLLSPVNPITVPITVPSLSSLPHHSCSHCHPIRIPSLPHLCPHHQSFPVLIAIPFLSLLSTHYHPILVHVTNHILFPLPPHPCPLLCPHPCPHPLQDQHPSPRLPLPTTQYPQHHQHKQRSGHLTVFTAPLCPPRHFPSAHHGARHSHASSFLVVAIRHLRSEVLRAGGRG